MYGGYSTLYSSTLCMVNALEVTLCAITSKVRWDSQAEKKKEVAEREEKEEEAEEGQVCNRCMRRYEKINALDIFLRLHTCIRVTTCIQQCELYHVHVCMIRCGFISKLGMCASINKLGMCELNY